MSSIPILLLILLPFSTAKFYIPRNSSCTSSDIPGGYRIYCSQVESAEAGFNVTVQSKDYVNVECRNSHDWIDFLTNNELGLKRDHRLVLSGCELPSAEFVGRSFGYGKVKFLKVEELQGRESKHRLNIFPDLKELVLSNNYLGRVDADLLYGQYNLTKLDMSATQIQFPAEFFVKSKSLIHLDLSMNGLRNLKPGVFDGLENLRTLNLSNNLFGTLEPKLFRGMSSLGFLDLSDSLLYVLPNEIFRDTISLTFVDLSGNHFSNIPENLFSHDLDKLKFVRMESNIIRMPQLPSRLVNNLSSLKVLSLLRFNLQQLSKYQFRGLVSVVDLDLSENELEMLPDDLLMDTHELRILDVSSNKLQALPGGFFAHTNKLMKLDLSKNRISTLDGHFSDGLKALLGIYVHDNLLEYVHSNAFSSLRHLMIARMARNRLTFQRDNPENPSPFCHCDRLEVLDLSRNAIKEMLPDCARALNNFHIINLSHNKLTYIGPQDLDFASEPLSIDLSHNHISIVNVSLDFLRNHLREIAINLNENPIDCHCDVYPLQQYVVNIKAFKHVHLLVDEITCNGPRNRRGLRFSQLSGMKLECTSANGRSKRCASGGACDCWITPANRTLMIDCARRKLTEAPSWIGTWDDLQVNLDLSGNFLTTAPKLEGNGYDKVQSLNLADNQITSIDENLLSPALRHLHLERNKLTWLDVHLAISLTDSGVSLWLGGNPWLCDKTMRETRSFFRNFAPDSVVDHKEALCENVEEPMVKKLWTATEWYTYLSSMSTPPGTREVMSGVLLGIVSTLYFWYMIGVLLRWLR